MKNLHILSTLSFFSVFSALSVQANAGCTVTAVPAAQGGTCPQECLDPIGCQKKNVNYRKCLKLIGKYLNNDAGAIAKDCMHLCAPPEYDIKCDEDVSSKSKPQSRSK